MAKQTFTTGQVLTAAQMTSLQQTAMGGGSATAKTASYTLVAADAGTTVIMNSGSATTITVNTGLFAAGDTVFIINQGAGICTITAGTATVSTAASLAMAQNETGQLYFLSTSSAIFTENMQTAAAGGKVLQVVSAVTTTPVNIATTTQTDTGITASITPTAASSKVLVIVSYNSSVDRETAESNAGALLLRAATTIMNYGTYKLVGAQVAAATRIRITDTGNITYLDSPATTSATTYKVQGAVQNAANGADITFQYDNAPSTITLLEIGA